jgi:hypothetical protein
MHWATWRSFPVVDKPSQILDPSGLSGFCSTISCLASERRRYPGGRGPVEKDGSVPGSALLEQRVEALAGVVGG